jgi:hypothetical protein
MTPVCFPGARTYAQALWLLPVMAFFVLGMHAGYAIYFPELFPTRLRATGSSACFNLGRVLGAMSRETRPPGSSTSSALANGLPESPNCRNDGRLTSGTIL